MRTRDEVPAGPPGSDFPVEHSRGAGHCAILVAVAITVFPLLTGCGGGDGGGGTAPEPQPATLSFSAISGTWTGEFTDFFLETTYPTTQHLAAEAAVGDSVGASSYGDDGGDVDCTGRLMARSAADNVYEVREEITGGVGCGPGRIRFTHSGDDSELSMEWFTVNDDLAGTATLTRE